MCMCVCVCVQSDGVKALRIFAEESVDMKSLPREKVLNHLVVQAPYCPLPGEHFCGRLNSNLTNWNT